jgi:hypothetical protein
VTAVALLETRLPVEQLSAPVAESEA